VRNVVVGLGNPLRRDDGVGPAVADLVARRAVPGIAVVALTGDDPATLLDTWLDARRVVVVEAVRSRDAAPGSVVRLDARRLERGRPAASSHGVDLATTYHLSAALGRPPERLVVVGVQIVDTGLGRGLSPAVAAALPDVVGRVLAEFGEDTAGG
jgi:hydrogenase maturation protease